MTREELKELWEWCGFALTKAGRLLYNDASVIDDSCHVKMGFPNPTLDNLFRYAVPKMEFVHKDLTTIRFIPTIEKTWHCEIKWLDSVIKGKAFGDTPAEALARAILQVIKEKG